MNFLGKLLSCIFISVAATAASEKTREHLVDKYEKKKKLNKENKDKDPKKDAMDAEFKEV